jgi:Skp family chaperone for outer membrane proteins
MRLLLAFPIVALGFASQAAYAQVPTAKAAPPGAPVEKVLTPEESSARIEAIRQKSEALQRARDVKLRKATRSICVGC